jgi:hypothetical protein
MDRVVVNILVGTIITIVIGTIGYFIKNMIVDIKTSIKIGISGVTDKLDTVLNNQQSQQITIVKMEKDIATTIDISKDMKRDVNSLETKVQNHEVVLAEIKQWKKDREENV